MKAHGYSCDGCGKAHLFGPLTFSQALPAGWFSVMPGGWRLLASEPWTFCSKECLWKYLERSTDSEEKQVQE